MFVIQKGVGRPIQYKGLEAQYISWLGMVCVGALILFAVLYLLGVNPYLVLGFVSLLSLLGGVVVYRMSKRYGTYGWMKRVASRRLPEAIAYQALDSRLPLAGVDSDTIFSNGGDMTLVYRMELPEIFTCAQSDYEAIHSAFVKALKMLPEETIFHKQDWFVKKGFVPAEREEAPSFLEEASDAHFLERPYLEHEVYCMFCKRADGTPLSDSALSNLIRPSLAPPQTLDPNARLHFEEAVERFVHVLMETGLVKMERLRNADLLSRQGGAGLIEKYLGLMEDRGRRVQQDIRFDDGIGIGNQRLALYTLSELNSLPETCSPFLEYRPYHSETSKMLISMGSVLGPLLAANHLYNQFIYVGNATKTLQGLERRLRRFQSLATWSRNNAIARDSIAAFLKEAAAEQRQVVKFHANVQLWAPDPAILRDSRNRLAVALSQMNAGLHEETVGAPQLFWAGLPGNEGDLPMNETLDTFGEQAACFLNWDGQYRSSISPVGLRLGDRLTGMPVHVDISDEPLRQGICTNRNKFVLGPSGSGKSFFVAHMLHTYYQQGTHIVVVDIGHSYRSLCTLVKGYYFTYTETQPIAFNPFFVADRRMPDTEKKESIKTLLNALWKKGDEPYHRSEYVALSELINAYYAYLETQPEVFPCFNTFYSFVKDRVKEKSGAVPQGVDFTDLLYVLKPYYKGGEFDYLLNASQNLDLMDQPFIVFEIDAVKDHPILFPVVTIIIMEIFIAKMRRLAGVRKMIVVEEAWKALANNGMADYIRYLFKTVRKFFGEAVVVTQEVEDIISSEIVKHSIIENSDCKILLDQRKYEHRFEDIQKLLSLSEKDQALVLSMNRNQDPHRKYKEVYINLGGKVAKVYRLEVAPEEYYTYTTDQQEKLEVEAAVTRSGGDLQKGIRTLTQMKRGIRNLFGILLIVCLPCASIHAQVPVVGVVGSILNKIITAMDLKVQQEQLSTMELQEDQQLLENDLSSTSITGISYWVGQEQDLYATYYQDLWQIRQVLSTYSRIKTLWQTDQQLLQAYQQAMALFSKDPHFSLAELQQMDAVYQGLLELSARNLDELSILINPFQTQMSDGRRLALIDQTQTQEETNLQNLKAFTWAQELLSLSRTRDQNDAESIRVLYGLQ